MPFERWLTIATALAGALVAAHGKGIVHRDLKPGNVMVTPSGSVKVDVGLARMSRLSGADVDQQTVGLTQDGIVMGTVPYMWPEQVRGRTVDARSDLFSLGAILYEMACGRRPCRAATTTDLMAAILRDAPEPVAASRADLPGRPRVGPRERGRRPRTALPLRLTLPRPGAATSDGPPPWT